MDQFDFIFNHIQAETSDCQMFVKHLSKHSPSTDFSNFWVSEVDCSSACWHGAHKSKLTLFTDQLLNFDNHNFFCPHSDLSGSFFSVQVFIETEGPCWPEVFLR